LGLTKDSRDLNYWPDSNFMGPNTWSKIIRSWRRIQVKWVSMKNLKSLDLNWGPSEVDPDAWSISSGSGLKTKASVQGSITPCACSLGFKHWVLRQHLFILSHNARSIYPRSLYDIYLSWVRIKSTHNLWCFRYNAKQYNSLKQLQFTITPVIIINVTIKINYKLDACKNNF
jgi:hypothetical protein